MDPDTIGSGSNILDGFFNLVDRGLGAYQAIDAAKDARAKTAETSKSPTNTAVNPAGAVVVSPQTLSIALAAVVAIGAVILIARK